MENLYLYAVVLPVYALAMTGLALCFKKAGEAWWKALVPVLNIVVLQKITGRPVWRTVLFFIPVINFVMMVGAVLDLARSFGRHKFIDHLFAVIVPWLYFVFIGLSKGIRYAGKWREMSVEYHKTHKKREVREWLDALLFAGASAVLIRTYMIEAFMIPTTSMEGSLKAGDFLFVSKYSYGVRLPMVPLAMPFVHNSLPGTSKVKSYLPWPVLPYYRTPGLGKVQRYDAVVFNYPDDDEHPDVPELGAVKEIPMKQNYIKRCVGIPGDSLYVRNGVLHVNGEEAWSPPNEQHEYYITDTAGVLFKKNDLLKELGFRFNLIEDLKWRESGKVDGNYGNDNLQPVPQQGYRLYVAHMNKETANKLSAMPGLVVKQAIKLEAQEEHDPKGTIFPKNIGQFPWTKDNFGPIYIPEKGKTVDLNRKVLPLYRKIIEVYEGHKLDLRDGKILIDGKEATTYTFEKDYYWMMGDNRDQSLDARFWGYVPEDHVIGKPILVLFSWDGGPVWNRFFKGPASWLPENQ